MNVSIALRCATDDDAPWAFCSGRVFRVLSRMCRRSLAAEASLDSGLDVPSAKAFLGTRSVTENARPGANSARRSRGSRISGAEVPCPPTCPPKLSCLPKRRSREGRSKGGSCLAAKVGALRVGINDCHHPARDPSSPATQTAAFRPNGHRAASQTLAFPSPVLGLRSRFASSPTLRLSGSASPVFGRLSLLPGPRSPVGSRSSPPPVASSPLFPHHR